MKKLALTLFALALLPSLAARAADLSVYDSARKADLANAQTEIQLMDKATPEELESLFNLPAGEEVSAILSGFLVEIRVSIASQSLNISFPGGDWNTIISSARPGYHTVTGCFTNPRLELMHYSSKYENSPMPHSMFFYGGYAIHGTDEESELGHPASHGCVRVSKRAAAYLYGIVQQYGPRNTRICIE